MIESDFHDRMHHWDCDGDEEQKCWCEPLIVPLAAGLDPELYAPLVYHRPDFGFVFWEKGEQGPMPINCWLLVNPTFDRIEDL